MFFGGPSKGGDPDLLETSRLRPHAQFLLDCDALAARLGPGDGDGVDLPALLRQGEAVQSFEDDAALKVAVKGHAEMVPHHERQEDRSWRLEVLGDVTGDRDGNRGDAPSLDGALHERDRLVSYRSGWGE